MKLPPVLSIALTFGLLLGSSKVAGAIPQTQPLNELLRLPSLGGSGSGKAEHNETDQCPPGTQREAQNCNDVRQIAYAMANQKGYQMAGSVPWVMTQPYQKGYNDCSTGNAHVACMYNSACTAPYGELLGLRSNSAVHATTLYRGKSGNTFECDFTPGSSGIFIKNRPDTRVGPAYPDPGEFVDAAYDCERNGAHSSLLNGGFGGGGAGGSLFDMAILQMLQQMRRQQQEREKERAEEEEANPSESEVDDDNERARRAATPTPRPDQRVSGKPHLATISEPGSAQPQRDIFGKDRTTPPQPKGDPKLADVPGGEELRPAAVWEEKRAEIL